MHDTVRVARQRDSCACKRCSASADRRFDGAANAIYQFAWSRFCDWYLELIKPQMVGDERGVIDDESKAVAGWVLDQILVLLHPFMPFITEELWHAMADPAHPRTHDLIVAQWPMADARSLDPEASREVDWLIRLVGEIRTARNELNVPPGARLPLHVRDANAATLARLERQAPALARLARVTHAEGEATGRGSQHRVRPRRHVGRVGEDADEAATQQLQTPPAVVVADDVTG